MSQHDSFSDAIINEKLLEDDADERRKKQILRELRGALNDAEFPEPTEIPWESEIQRRYDLI
jgi:hypothetical protein